MSFDQVAQAPLIGTSGYGPINGVDVTNGGLYVSVAGVWQRVGPNALTVLNAQTAAVINTATSITNSAITLPAKLLNIAGKTIQIYGAGVYSNTTSTPTVAFALKFGSVTLCTLTSEAVTNGVTNQAFNFDYWVTTASTGASGTLESHGLLNILLGSSATAPMKSYADANTAVSSAVDLTASISMTITGLSAGASNACTLRQLVVEIVN